MNLKLIETILFTKKEGLLRLQLHYNRLLNSSNYFNFDFNLNFEEFKLKVDEYLESISEFRDKEELVIKIEVNELGKFEFSNREAPIQTPSSVNVVLDSSITPLNNIQYLTNKTNNRDVYTEARQRNSVDGLFDSKFDVILINERLEVMESSIMNIIVQFNNDDFWYTPPLSSGCLPGVKRQELINSGELKERVITKENLIRCYKNGGRVQLINSVRGRYNVKILLNE